MKRLYAILLIALILLSGCSTFPLQALDPIGSVVPIEELAFEISFIDVGQGDAALIICDGATMLIDGGNAEDSDLDLIDKGVDLSADVLKVGHGSNTSSSYIFLYHVQPTFAVISCGKDNSYGHPHDEVLSRLRDADVKLYRTDFQGHITCTSDGKTITFATERNAGIKTNPTAGSNYDSELYIGNVNSKKLHLPTCNALPAEQNQVIFSNREDAYSQGYTDCQSCMT